jgi:hypothetical protein
MSSNQTAMTTSLQVLEKGKAFHYKKIWRSSLFMYSLTAQLGILMALIILPRDILFIIIIQLVKNSHYKNKGSDFQSHLSLSSKNCLCFDSGLTLTLRLEPGLSESVPSMKCVLLFLWPPATQVEQNFNCI